MTRAEQVAANKALIQAVEDLWRLAKAYAEDLGQEREPWLTHADYPGRVATDLRRASRSVELAADELTRTLRGGR